MEPVVQPKRLQTIAQQRNAMMSFLKGQGYKGLQKLRYPEMKSLYDAVRESIQRNVDSIIPYESEKEKQIMDARKDKAAKRSLKRKRTTNDELIELRTNTVDELRNYLRVVDFENPKKSEVGETKSMISTFSVVESSEGDYLIFHREDGSF